MPNERRCVWQGQTVGHAEQVMGTVVSFVVHPGGVGHAAVRSALKHACRVLHDADGTFSTWKPDSPLSRLRRGESTLEDLPTEVATVLGLCECAKVASGGWFDPWAMPGGVDPTGLVKGWAAQRALEPLRELTLTGALINAAGDVASFGGPAFNEAFRLGVVRPANPRALACIVESPGAVATSGTYERGNHLINPFSGVASSTASATVTGPELALADALATALAVAGPSGLEFVEAIAGYEGLLIETTDRVHVSSGFPMLTHFLDRWPS